MPNHTGTGGKNGRVDQFKSHATKLGAQQCMPPAVLPFSLMRRRNVFKGLIKRAVFLGAKKVGYSSCFSGSYMAPSLILKSIVYALASVIQKA